MDIFGSAFLETNFGRPLGREKCPFFEKKISSRFFQLKKRI
jgi:hypothetical protein